MEVETARRNATVDPFGRHYVKNQLCSFWLAGKCNRNPCRFMHIESPAPQPGRFCQTVSHDEHKVLIHKTTWRSPVSDSSKSTTGSTNKSRSSAHRFPSTQPIASPNVGKKSLIVDKKPSIISNGTDTDVQTQQKVLTTEKIESDTSCQEKFQPKQCKSWITDTCALGDKCKDMHSLYFGLGITLLSKLGGHNKEITGIALPSGYNKLLSAGKDRCILTWDCNSGQCVGSVLVDADIGCMIVEGPMVFVGMENAVKVWNSEAQTEFTLSQFIGLVHCLAVDKDTLFVGIEDGTILVWKWCPDTNIPKPAAMLKGHNDAVCSFVIGGNRLYSGSKDCTIRAWDLETLQCVQILNGHTANVTSLLCWDCYLFSASLDNTLKIWAEFKEDSKESGIIKVVSEFREECGFLELCGIHDSEEKPILLCSCNDYSVRLYDLPSFNERGRIFTKQEATVVESGTEGLFFIGDGTGEITVCKLD